MSQVRDKKSSLTLGYIEFIGAEGLTQIQRGDILLSSIRDRDILIAWGDEEFLILMPGALVETSSAITKRIKNYEDEQRDNGSSWQCVYGFAEYRPDSDFSLDDFIELSRQKMILNRKADSNR